LTVKDAPGDGIKVTQSERPTFRNVHAYYTDPDLSKHGAYALYPAECNQVLIENCEVEGSTDAAIYLGQSTTGIVRNNKAHDSVIGIEAENSLDIEIYGNEAWGNTTGILVVNLPDLPHKGVHRVSVHDNISRENNHANFGDGFAAGIPPGTGMVIMASDSVQVFANQFRDNNSPGLLLVSWPTFELIDPSFHATDALFDQFSEGAYIHDNTFTNNGQHPASSFTDPPVSLTTVPDIFWDGFVDPAKTEADKVDKEPPPDQRHMCIKNNGTATFINFIANGRDLAPYNCEYPALPAITLSSG
jgi:parallel beta-helix repeat protein